MVGETQRDRAINPVLGLLAGFEGGSGVFLQQGKMLYGQRGDLADWQHAYAVQGWTVGQSRHQAFSSGMSVEIESGLETVRGRAIAR